MKTALNFKINDYNYGAYLIYSLYVVISGGRSTQIKYLSKSTDVYNKILFQ